MSRHLALGLTGFALLVSSLSVSAQAQDADALMRQFAAWSADDVDAVRQTLADDVVLGPPS